MYFILIMHMKLEFVEFELKLPEGLPLQKLRPWILSKLSKYGEPLRWSISNVETIHESKVFCQLRVEAVVLLN